MALYNDRRQLPIDLNTNDLLFLNPFAGEQEEETPAVLVAHTAHNSVTNNALPFKRHARSRTEAYTYRDRDSSGGHLHPLRSAGLTNGSSDAGITRPHLSRIVKVGTLVDAPPIQSDNPDGTSPLKGEEKCVLVHEVCHALSCIISGGLKFPHR